MIVLINVLALVVGIYLQHAATRPSWASDSRKSYGQIFGVTDGEVARWFNSERFARLTKERVPLKDVGLPLDPLVYGYASLVNYLRDGYFLGDASPRRSITGVRTPMLFIHGWADTVIPYRMTEELYKAKPGVKLLLTHDGGHGLIDIKGGGSIVENREAFERKVDELLALAAKGGA